MANPGTEGRVYTEGHSYRARAEAQQRKYRAGVLKKAAGEYGHWLDEDAANGGHNFLLPLAFEQAKARAAKGKGVAETRTFSNMLSSQAMCFNLFAPLSADLITAAKVFSAFLPIIKTVNAVTIEHTPKRELFNDQSGLAGVDCDLLVDFHASDGAKGVLVVETKFVEPEFSTCGFRKNGVKRPCPRDLELDATASRCRYAEKGYRYWQRAFESASVKVDGACPFSGPSWQLWVNHTLAHAEARDRGATHAYFAVLAPDQNRALLREGRTLEEFRRVLSRPETLLFISVEELIANLEQAAEGAGARAWIDGLRGRYVVA